MLGKICYFCKIEKDITEFHKHSKRGSQWACKSCKLEIQNIYRAKLRKIKLSRKLIRRRSYLKYRSVRIEDARRRKGVLQGMKHLSAAYKAEIDGMYLFCRIFRGFEVDHIVPVKHSEVCGLHTPTNLQVLPRTENRRKRNQFLEEYRNG